FMGTGLAFITASAVFRMMRPPYVAGGAGIWWGWALAAAQGRPRYDDEEFRRFLRRYQWRALLNGKVRATAAMEAEQAGRWRAVSASDEDAGEAPAGARRSEVA